jgi:hypothetical protein
VLCCARYDINLISIGVDNMFVWGFLLIVV